MIDITEPEKEEILSEIRKQINVALKSVRFKDVILSKYYAANEKTLNNVEVLNGFMNKLYSSLGLQKDFKEEISILDDDLNDKLTKILRKIRSGLEKKSAKPNRLLVYSLQIEDNNHCGAVLDKNIEIIEDILAHYESRGGEIGDDCSQSLNDKMEKTVASVFKLDRRDLIMEYAKILSEDDSVTLEEWSEFLEEIIPYDRESCSSSCWVQVG